MNGSSVALPSERTALERQSAGTITAEMITENRVADFFRINKSRNIRNLKRDFFYLN